MRRRAGHDVIKKGASRRPFYFVWVLLSGFRHSAFVASCRISVDQSLPRCPVEQLHGGQSLFGSASRRPFEGGAERGLLSAVADGSGTWFPHVLFRWSKIWHELISEVFWGCDVAGKSALERGWRQPERASLSRVNWTIDPHRSLDVALFRPGIDVDDSKHGPD